MACVTCILRGQIGGRIDPLEYISLINEFIRPTEKYYRLHFELTVIPCRSLITVIMLASEIKGTL